MPKIINAFAPEDGLASTLGSLANSIFGGNVAQQEVYRQNAIGKRRVNEALPALADAVVAGDTAQATRYGILSEQDPKFTGGYNQFRVVNQYGPQSPQALTATMAVPGANYGHTIQGTNAAMANSRAIEEMRAQRQYEAVVNTADNTPVNVIGPDGKPTIVSRRAAIGSGMQPVLDFGQQRGTLLNNTPLTPEQTLRVVGAEPKAEDVIVATLDSGQTVPARARADGFYAVEDGRKLTGVISVGRVVAQNNEGLTSPMQNQRLQSRINTENAVADIDALITTLSQPNADQSTGYLGSISRVLNNARSQAEATSRLFGSNDSGRELQLVAGAIDDATARLLSNPALAAKLQTLAGDSASIRAQISSLAYAIAKTNNPSGQISKRDVDDAADQLAASLMDPRVAVRILGETKDRMLRHQATRERLYDQQSRSRSPAPAPAAPTAGAPQGGPGPVDYLEYFR